jgi:hypothetical protein
MWHGPVLTQFKAHSCIYLDWETSVRIVSLRGRDMNPGPPENEA